MKSWNALSLNKSLYYTTVLIWFINCQYLIRKIYAKHVSKNCIGQVFRIQVKRRQLKILDKKQKH